MSSVRDTYPQWGDRARLVIGLVSSGYFAVWGIAVWRSINRMRRLVSDSIKRGRHEEKREQ